MLIIGSLAEHLSETQGTDYLVSKVNDIDVIGTQDMREQLKLLSGGKIDYHQVPKEVYDALEKVSNKDYLRPTTLYTLKVSHALFDVKWEKTAANIIRMQEKYGYQNVDKEMFDVLYRFWLSYHHNNKDKVNLNVSNEEFFDDGVQYYRAYEHDDLHLMMAYGDRPMYERCKSDLSKALLDEEKFNALSYTEKLQLCREEIYVTALERFFIPTWAVQEDPTKMYRQAIKKLVTSMTKGWFPLFILTHLTDLKKPDKDYVEQFWKLKKHYKPLKGRLEFPSGVTEEEIEEGIKYLKETKDESQ